MTRGRFDVVEVAGIRTLHLDSSALEECLSYYREHRIERLAINASRGYLGHDLEFVRRHPYLTELVVVAPVGRRFDLEPLCALKGLRYLVLNDPSPLVLSRFERLESFYGIWDAGMDLSGCRELRSLSLSKYNAEGALETLPAMPSLQQLELVDSKLQTLKGVERFATLRSLVLAHLGRLTSLVGIEALEALEVLDCDACRRLVDHSRVASLVHLRKLQFNDCGSMPSLAFLSQLPHLERFAFVDTNIVDGDLRPVLRLNSVGFFMKKHYSHSPEQVDALIAQRKETQP